jgi:hypothetical protein
MEGFPWTFHEVTVRCPCGTCFKDADTYLQHKRSCKNHSVETSIESGPVGVDRKAHKPSLKASVTPAPRNAGNSHGNRPTKKPHPSRNVQSSLPVCKPPTDTCSALSGFDLSVVGSISSAAGQHSSPPQCVISVCIAMDARCSLLSLPRSRWHKLGKEAAFAYGVCSRFHFLRPLLRNLYS